MQDRVRRLQDRQSIDDIINSSIVKGFKAAISANASIETQFLELFNNPKVISKITELITTLDKEKRFSIISELAGEFNIIDPHAKEWVLDLIDHVMKQILSNDATAHYLLHQDHKQILDGVNELRRESRKNSDTLARLCSDFMSVKTRLDEVPDFIDITYKDAINTIRDKIERGFILSARQMALNLERKLNHAKPRDNETVFLIYAYIAQTYHDSPDGKEEAISYTIKAIDNCPDDSRRFRNQAILRMLRDEYESAFEAINKALEINPKDVKAINVKANILVLYKQGEKALELYKEKPDKDTDLWWANKAWVEFEIGHYQDAISSAKKAIDINSSVPHTYSIVVNSVLVRIRSKLDCDGTINDDDCRLLADIRDNYLNAAINLFSSEQAEYKSKVLYQRGVINIWLGNHNSALIDLLEAHKLNPLDSEIIKRLILLYKSLDKYREASDLLAKLRKLEPDDSDADLLNCEILLETANIKEALDYLDKIIEVEKRHQGDMRYLSLLIESYDRNFQSDLAERKLDQLEQTYPDSKEIKYARIRHLHRIGNVKLAIDLSEDELEKQIGPFGPQFKVLLADMLCEKGDQESLSKASQLYSEVANIEIVESILENYAKALYKSSQLEGCLSLCNKVQSRHGFQKNFAELEAAIYFNTENFEAASMVLQILTAKDPGNYHRISEYAYCFFRLGNNERAAEILRQTESRLETSSDKAFVANAYAMIGKYEKAQELSYQALVESFNDSKFHLNYHYIFMLASTHIDNIKEHYIRQYQDILNKFEDRFPDSDGLRMKEISHEPEIFRRQMYDLLKDSQNQKEEAGRIYAEKKFPVAFLAHAIGRDIITTWSYVINNQDFKVWSATGNPKEHSSEVAIASNAKEIMIDPIALLTIKALGLQDELLLAFQTVYISQTFIDEINQLIATQSITVNRDHGVLVIKDKQVFYEQMSSESVKKSIVNLKAILQFLRTTNKIHIIGKTIGRSDETSNIAEKLKEALGKETIEVILEANARSIPMFADDSANRALAANEFGVKSFGTRALLDVLFKRGIITKERYHDSIIKMISLNYHFVIISPETILHALDKHGYLLDDEAMAVFSSLRHPDNDVNQLVVFSIAFLQLLWREDIPRARKQRCTEILLNVITGTPGRNKALIIKVIQKNKKVIFSPLLSHLEELFDRTLEAWLKAHGNIIIG